MKKKKLKKRVIRLEQELADLQWKYDMKVRAVKRKEDCYKACINRLMELNRNLNTKLEEVGNYLDKLGEDDNDEE